MARLQRLLRDPDDLRALDVECRDLGIHDALAAHVKVDRVADGILRLVRSVRFRCPDVVPGICDRALRGRTLELCVTGGVPRDICRLRIPPEEVAVGRCRCGPGIGRGSAVWHVVDGLEQGRAVVEVNGVLPDRRGVCRVDRAVARDVLQRVRVCRAIRGQRPSGEGVVILCRAGSRRAARIGAVSAVRDGLGVEDGRPVIVIVGQRRGNMLVRERDGRIVLVPRRHSCASHGRDVDRALKLRGVHRGRAVLIQTTEKVKLRLERIECSDIAQLPTKAYESDVCAVGKLIDNAYLVNRVTDIHECHISQLTVRRNRKVRKVRLIEYL